MIVADNTVVSLSFRLEDTLGNVIEQSEQPVSYLHGDFGGMFPLVEQGLAGKRTGDNLRLTLQPEDAFGDYDPQLVQMEPAERFPDGVEIGMQFEGTGSDSGDTLIYTVTEIAEGQVIVDANHPLAGQALVFDCTITDVRAASAEEIANGHPHQAGD